MTKLTGCVLAFLLLITSVTPGYAITATNTFLDPGGDTSLEQTNRRVQVPVLMYHRLLKYNPKNDPYTISPAAFEQDLNYLKSAGYSTITIEALLNFAKLGTPLPEKPVLLTFDDGYYNTIYYGVPLLETYGMNAVVFVVGKYSEMSANDNEENPNYSYITWKHMEGLPDCLEVQNHTWDMHNLNKGRSGIERKRKESKADYQIALASDLLCLQGRVATSTGRAPKAFAFPFGYQEACAVPVFPGVGIEVTFGSFSGINLLEAGNSEQLYGLKRLLRTPQKSAQTLITVYNNKLK